MASARTNRRGATRPRHGARDGLVILALASLGFALLLGALALNPASNSLTVINRTTVPVAIRSGDFQRIVAACSTRTVGALGSGWAMTRRAPSASSPCPPTRTLSRSRTAG